MKIDDLRKKYDYLVLAYGAAKDKLLGIPGETSLKGVVAAKDFVGWYNGQPDQQKLQPDLQCTDTAVIIGQGNVALDIARVLLSPIDILAKTDITENALENLKTSRIKKVHVVGRRGPYQVAFSAKEFREMLSLPKVGFNIPMHLLQLNTGGNNDNSSIATSRARKRIINLMKKYQKPDFINKEWELDFFKSPKRFIESQSREGRVGSIEFECNKLDENLKAIATGELSSLDTGLVFRSIGYRSVAVPGLPFDHHQGRVPNVQGRVMADQTDSKSIIPGLYTSGWLKTGPVGVIASTMIDAYQTAECILEDMEYKNSLNSDCKVPSRVETLNWLRDNKPNLPVTFSDWKMLDDEEKKRGIKLGKPREKYTEVEEMLKIMKRSS